MAAKEDSRAIRSETARRYAEWVVRQMRLRDWDQAMLSRRSGLPKQTVNTIVKGAGYQPTASQVAALAQAFRVAPEDVLAGIGLWPESRASQLLPEPQLVALYSDLDEIQRRALVRIGRTLREVQAEYEAAEPEPLPVNEEEEDIGPIAAHPEPMPEVEEWPPREGEAE